MTAIPPGQPALSNERLRALRAVPDDSAFGHCGSDIRAALDELIALREAYQGAIAVLEAMRGVLSTEPNASLTGSARTVVAELTTLREATAALPIDSRLRAAAQAVSDNASSVMERHCGFYYRYHEIPAESIAELRAALAAAPAAVERPKENSNG